MTDYGQLETDSLLSSVEKKIQKIYGQTEKEVQKKLSDYMKQFSSEDKAKQKLLKKGQITQSEYQNWRAGKMLTGKKYQELVNTLAADYTNADKIAMSVVRGHLPEAYAINRNFAAFQVEKGSLIDTSFTLYDRHTVEALLTRNKQSILPKPAVDIPKDLRWNRTKIKEQITKSVIAGDSIPHVADRLQRVTDMDRSAAIRNARTAMTAAQNRGRVDGYKYASKLGIDLKKEWLATLDGRTRHAHRDLDGKTAPIDGVFSIGGVELEYPGDPNCSDPSLVYNCRCTLIPNIKGVDNSNEPRHSKLGDMSYDEWKSGKSKIAQKDNWAAIRDRTIRNARAHSTDEHLRDNWSYDFWDSLSEEEKKGIKRYTGSSYEEMNAILREDRFSSADEYYKKIIKGCESGLSHRGLADDTILYRGMGSKRTLSRVLGVDKTELSEMVKDGSIVGQRFVEKGFCSTGVTEGAGWDKPVVLEIVAPKGTKGFYVDEISSVHGEKECLLQRGTIFEIFGFEELSSYSSAELKLKVIVCGSDL